MKNMINVSLTNNNRSRRIVHLPSDWNNLFNDETLTHIKSFANDQSDFFSTFAGAYEKISNAGTFMHAFNLIYF